MKLWKEDTRLDKLVEEFTVGKDAELDLKLAPYDALGSMAHAIMLEKIGVLTRKESAALLAELRQIYSLAEAGKLVIEDGVEDIHSQIELLLTRKLGDAGKKIHTGRSRNDQVLLDIRLYAREQMKDLVDQVDDLIGDLLEMSDKYKDNGMPGYTHSQVAMPSSFGLWFASFAESLVDDLIMFQAAYNVINKNPLGSAAGYGTSIPLDRRLTTDLLGFREMNVNVVYAMAGRGKTEWVLLQGIGAIASTLSRMANDVVTFMGQNFGFFTLDEEVTTGSSIMPHKRNPDVFELLRAKSNRLLSLPGEVLMINGNLATGYFRDKQILKEILIPAFDDLGKCITVLQQMLPRLLINEDILKDPIYNNLYSVDALNQQVMNGVPFREAYRIVSDQVKAGEFVKPENGQHSHEGSIGNLCNDEITRMKREVTGSFGFDETASAIEHLLGAQSINEQG